MTQLSLYGGNAPHAAGSATSKAAGESVDWGSMRDRVLDVIAWRSARNTFSSRGLTDDEIERILGLRHQSVSPRRRELVLLGKVVKSGRTRATRSGRQATVWVTA